MNVYKSIEVIRSSGEDKIGLISATDEIMSSTVLKKHRITRTLLAATLFIFFATVA